MRIKRVVDFLADKDVKRKIMEEITTQREKLKGYFRQKGISDEDSDEIAVVDIGWERNDSGIFNVEFFQIFNGPVTICALLHF